MKTRPASPYLLLLILAAPLLTFGQPPPPSIKGHPLYGSGAQALSAPAPISPSSDPRLLELTKRFKTAIGQVREANPAVLPGFGKPASVTRLQQRAAGNVAIRMRHDTGTPRSIEGAELEPATAVSAGGILAVFLALAL